MTGPGPDVHLTWPNVFNPFPANLPPVVPPPSTEASLRAPFGINTSLYNFVLRPEIPILVATAYILCVSWGNIYNKQRDYKAWSISKKDSFKYFVIVHNVVLALYSFATFVAMFRAITKTLPAWDEASGGLWRAKTADALCKLHGPRGLGDAATFNTTINIWEIKNSLIRVGSNGVPDLTDVGRLWNEGLAFWGWMFYVSKFYEVLDTFIILAKGKRSATLQTYHHAGAMLCMWAGIRYMSPPIWMFVFINSAIHAMMYTYFTCSALGVKVPQPLKRTLTGLQIFQFVFGASYAALHLFIKYDIPISTPFQFAHTIERAVSSVSSAGTAATKSATSVASSVSSFVENPIFGPTAAAWVKKFLLRAAGDAGPAERVHDGRRDAFLPGGRSLLPGRSDALPHHRLPQVDEMVAKPLERRFETRWRTDWTTINCIDTSGEAFAIYLNLLYLAPLTFLFARFFVRAYTARGRPKSFQQAARSASDSARDAKKQMHESVEKAGEAAEDKADEKSRQLQDEVQKDLEDFKNGVRNRRISDRIGETVKSYEEKVKEIANGKSASGSGSPARTSSPNKKASQSSLKEETSKDKSKDGSKEEASKDGSKSQAKDESNGIPKDVLKDEGSKDEAKGQAKDQSNEASKKSPTKLRKGSAKDASKDGGSGHQGGDTDDPTYADVVKDTSEGDAKKEGEDIISDTQPTRPGAGAEEEDTDAMGKSGALVSPPDSPEAKNSAGSGDGGGHEGEKSNE